MLALACALACALVGAAGDVLRVQLSDAPISPPISPTFASFSLEISDAAFMLGMSPAPPNAAYAQLLRNLQTPGGRGPQLRVGGNSADFSVWWPSGVGPLPPNQTYAITEADLLSYRAALPLFNGSIVIDSSMYFADNTTFAAAHVAAVRDILTWERVDGIEVGNEVEIYHDDGVRPHSWGVGDYVREFSAHVAAFAQVGLPPRMIQGAVFCCNNSDYNRALPNYTATFAAAGVLASISYHRYAVGGCGGKTVLLGDLMLDGAAEGMAAYVTPFVAACRLAGIPFRIGEGNSVSCGGRRGISDAFASALWGLDAMLATASVGVATFNFHGGRSAHYTPIGVLPSGAPDVRPLYYAMVAMQAASARESVVMTATILGRTNPFVKAYALRDSTAAWRVVVIHKDYNATAPTAVSIIPSGGAAAPGSFATLVRLLAPGITALRGVTWAGLTWDGTTDGKPSGTPVSERISADASGAFTFSLPPATAALLSL